jgi:hypothetical protein
MHGINTRNLPVYLRYIYLKLAKTPCYFNYVLCFFLLQSWGWVRGIGTSDIEEVVKEKGRRVNMVQIMYTDVCKCKNDTC